MGVIEDFPLEQVVPVHVFDEDLVVFRAADGSLGALDAYCPHLGAHLGHGGTVHDGCVRCPFHGWEWAADGTCASVPYADGRPPRARTRSVPVVEQDGVVLIWRGTGETPNWHMPRFDIDRWTAPLVMRRTARTHPQEVLENTADLAHFRFVHETHMVEPIADLQSTGQVFECSVQSAPDAVAPAWRLDNDVLLEGTVFCHGPGLAGATLGPKGMPVHALQRLYVTPAGDGAVNLLGLVNLRIDEFCDAATATSLLAAYGEAVFENWDRDIAIWENKRHLRKPVLQRSERAIWSFRRWYAQYYDQPEPAR